MLNGKMFFTKTSSPVGGGTIPKDHIEVGRDLVYDAMAFQGARGRGSGRGTYWD